MSKLPWGIFDLDQGMADVDWGMADVDQGIFDVDQGIFDVDQARFVLQRAGNTGQLLEEKGVAAHPGPGDEIAGAIPDHPSAILYPSVPGGTSP